MAERVLPHLDCEAVSRWALCAFHALGERNAQVLRRELPALLQAGDERLCGGLSSSHAEDDTPAGLRTAAERSPERRSDSEPERGQPPGEVRPTRSGCQTGSRSVLPIGTPRWEVSQSQRPGAAHPTRSGCQTGSRPAPPTGTPGLEVSRSGQTGPCQALPEGAPVAEASQRQRPEADGAHQSGCQTGSCQASPARSAATESALGELPDALCLHRSACQTGSSQAPSARGFWLEPPFTVSGGSVLAAGGSIGLDGTCEAHTWSPVPWRLRPRLPSLPPLDTWAAEVSQRDARGSTRSLPEVRLRARRLLARGLDELDAAPA